MPTTTEDQVMKKVPIGSSDSVPTSTESAPTHSDSILTSTDSAPTHSDSIPTSTESSTTV